MTDLEIATELWDQLRDCPINSEEEIDEVLDFGRTLFEKGTSIYEIWHWFEEEFNLSVAKNLMKL